MMMNRFPAYVVRFRFPVWRAITMSGWDFFPLSFSGDNDFVVVSDALEHNNSFFFRTVASVHCCLFGPSLWYGFSLSVGDEGCIWVWSRYRYVSVGLVHILISSTFESLNLLPFYTEVSKNVISWGEVVRVDLRRLWRLFSVWKKSATLCAGASPISCTHHLWNGHACWFCSCVVRFGTAVPGFGTAVCHIVRVMRSCTQSSKRLVVKFVVKYEEAVRE